MDRFRAIATRHDKTARNYLALVQIASARLWLENWASTVSSSARFIYGKSASSFRESDGGATDDLVEIYSNSGRAGVALPEASRQDGARGVRGSSSGARPERLQRRVATSTIPAVARKPLRLSTNAGGWWARYRAERWRDRSGATSPA